MGSLSIAEGELLRQKLFEEEKAVVDSLPLILSPYFDNKIIDIITEYTRRPWHEFCFGAGIFNPCNVEIAGARIDKHYGEWLDIWSSMRDEPPKTGYRNTQTYHNLSRNEPKRTKQRNQHKSR